MRIGIEGQRLFRKAKHGMDVVAMELIKELQKIDTINQYFLFVKDGEDDDWYQPTPNFHLIRIKKSPYHIWEQILLPRAVKKYKIDLLHCTSNTAPVHVNSTLILTLHDIIYLENFKFISYKSTFYQLVGNLYRRWVVPKILNSSAKIITVSNTEKTTIIEKYPELNGKVEVIYNSFGQFFNDEIPIHFEEIIKKYQLPPKYFFCLGNKSPKKNLTNILKAYYLYLDRSEEKIPLVLADHSPGDLFLFLNSVNSEYKKYLKFIGYISNWEIPCIYKNSELFLYPSIRESFGIPILEAMKMGSPVITSEISCMPEVAGDAAYFVDPLDPESIAQGMIDISSSEKLRNNLIQKGYERTKKFSWSVSAVKLLDLYERVYEAKKEKISL